MKLIFFCDFQGHFPCLANSSRHYLGAGVSLGQEQTMLPTADLCVRPAPPNIEEDLPPVCDMPQTERDLASWRSHGFLAYLAANVAKQVEQTNILNAALTRRLAIQQTKETDLPLGYSMLGSVPGVSPEFHGLGDRAASGRNFAFQHMWKLRSFQKMDAANEATKQEEQGDHPTTALYWRPALPEPEERELPLDCSMPVSVREATPPIQRLKDDGDSGRDFAFQHMWKLPKDPPTTALYWRPALPETLEKDLPLDCSIPLSVREASPPMQRLKDDGDSGRDFTFQHLWKLPKDSPTTAVYWRPALPEALEKEIPVDYSMPRPEPQFRRLPESTGNLRDFVHQHWPYCSANVEQDLPVAPAQPHREEMVLPLDSSIPRTVPATAQPSVSFFSSLIRAHSCPSGTDKHTGPEVLVLMG